MPMYGISCRPENETELCQTWKVTENPNDMTLPESRFIPCSDSASGRAVLRQRYQDPKETLCDRRLYTVREDKYSSGTTHVYKYPIVEPGQVVNFQTHDDEARRSRFGCLMDIVQKYGRLLLTTESVRYHPNYHDSNLVQKESRNQCEGYYVYVVRYDPSRAKIRRTTALRAKIRNEKQRELRRQEAREAQKLSKLRKPLTQAYRGLSSAMSSFAEKVTTKYARAHNVGVTFTGWVQADDYCHHYRDLLNYMRLFDRSFEGEPWDKDKGIRAALRGFHKHTAKFDTEADQDAEGRRGRTKVALARQGALIWFRKLLTTIPRKRNRKTKKSQKLQRKTKVKAR